MRMCVDDLSRIEIHNLMESCDQVLIKVKDSAPTAVICTLAIKIAKHREEGERWRILQNKAHGQNINFLLVSQLCESRVHWIMLGQF